LPFKANCALIDLPRTKDGKEVHVVGLTPFTVERVIDIAFERCQEAQNICSSLTYMGDNDRIIELLEELKAA
jgi:hypothetical protein